MDNYSLKTCHMPREHTIVFIYLTSIIIFLFFKILKLKQTYSIKNDRHLLNSKKSNH